MNLVSILYVTKLFEVLQQFNCNVYNVPRIVDVDAASLQLSINNVTGKVSETSIHVIYHPEKKLL